MKNQLVLFFFIICSSISYAQSSYLDSIGAKDYDHSVIDGKLYELIYRSPVFVDEYVKNDHNNLLVGTSLMTGKFKGVHESSTTKDFRFQTQGKTVWNGFHLYGFFNYQKSIEDSTQLRHQTRINSSAPFYFGSERNNHYERSVYNIHAIVKKDILKGLPLTFALDYRLGDHFSNNDPRATLSDFQLDTETALGWNVDDFSVNLSGILGYGRERVSLAYKNDKYYNNLGFEEYTNWLMNGYGYSYRYTTRIRYNDDFRRAGAGLSANYRISPSSHLIFSSKWINEQQVFKHYENTELTYLSLGEYDLDRWTSSLTYFRRFSTDRAIYLNTRYGYYQGINYDPELRASNYSYYEHNVGIEGVYKRGRTQMGMSASYISVDKEDVLIQSYSLIEAIEPLIFVNKAWNTQREQKFLAHVGLGRKIVLTQDFLLPAIAENYFNRRVLVPEHLYQSTDYTHLDVNLGYQFQPFKKFKYGIYWNNSLLKPSGTMVSEEYAEFKLGKSRVNSELVFKVLF